jgi:hypothetical protein
MSFWDYAVLQRLQLLENRIMSKFEDMTLQLDGIQTAAANISADIDRLTGMIGTGPLTEAEAAVVLSRLATIKSSVDAIAAKTPEL